MIFIGVLCCMKPASMLVQCGAAATAELGPGKASVSCIDAAAVARMAYKYGFLEFPRIK